jgi:uncharacterized protein (DUF58 family)
MPAESRDPSGSIGSVPPAGGAGAGAGLIVQLLSCAACFLGAWVLPLRYPDLDPIYRHLLIAAGVLLLLIAGLTQFYRQQLSRLAMRLGMESRLLLPREGLVYLAMMLVIAVSALTGGNPDTGNMLLLVFGLMAGPFVVNGWVVVLMLLRLKVQRTAPESVESGAIFRVAVSIHNQRPLLSSHLLEVRDQLSGPAGEYSPHLLFMRIAPGERRMAEYQLRILQRGVYRLGPLKISSQFPLGIGEKHQTFDQTQTLTVYPAPARLLSGWRLREDELAAAAHSRMRSHGAAEDEFYGIREYRSGDNHRAVHWRSSARHGQLMVREQRPVRRAELLLLLDLYADSQADRQQLELAISFAAALCLQSSPQSAWQLQRMCLAGEQYVRVEPAGAAAFRGSALRALAECQAAPHTQLDQLLTDALRSGRGRRVVLLITPRPATIRHKLQTLTAEGQSGSGVSGITVLSAEQGELLRYCLPPDTGASADSNAGGVS